MNFIDYSKETTNTSLSTETSGIQLASFATDIAGKTDYVEFVVSVDSIDTKIDYDLLSIIPANAEIIKVDLTFYGTIEGARKLISANTNLARRVIIDNKYDNTEIDIRIEYTHNDDYYRVSDNVSIVSTIKTRLDIARVDISILSEADLHKYYQQSIQALTSRIDSLEQTVRVLTSSSTTS